ncbi:MAG: ABC transporter ATP-binding protein [Culicoidibacterales bacterium]
MLKVENLYVYYDKIEALHGISFHVNEGEIVTLIGANGAGKTTTLRALSKIANSQTEKFEFVGQDLTKVAAHSLVQQGLVQVPEGRRVFPALSVQENLEMGAYTTTVTKDDYDYIYKLFPRLKERKHQLAGTLSGGEQQMLAMGRALMSKPKLLLLDEPSMGLAPLIIQEIFRIIEEINKEGVTVLLVEQNANQALAIADRAYVLETGNIVKEGKGIELLNDDDVKKAYLGL